MLIELTVRNYGIIEAVGWSPAAGLNVITGETGAGKSLVVDAVEALFSGQVNEADIRHGEDTARIEGIFNLPADRASEPLVKLLAERGLESEDGTLLLNCDFRRRGRAVPRINRQAVSRSILRSVAAALLDIHGQSQHLSLLNRESHLDYLDAYAHTRELRDDFSNKAVTLNEIEREIQKLSGRERDMARQQELLNFQIEEIKQAELRADEEDELRREQNLLASAEKLKAAAYEVYRTIYGEDSAMSSYSAIDQLNDTLPPLRQLAESDPAVKPQLDYLEEIIHGLEEMAREIHSYGDNLSYDPRRLEEVQARLELIRSLQRKYGDSIREVLDYLEKAESELEGLSSSGERQRQLEEQREQLRAEMGAVAFGLSNKRTAAAERLAGVVQQECREMSMPEVAFEISITRGIAPEGIPFPDGELYQFHSRGVDRVEFIVSTNPGEPLQPLDKIASTGEISRFMLALKSALAEADMIPVLIFDEIDIGVGGRSGEVIGQKLWNLSRNHQVICVTHLPQIAAYADAHFNVSKQASGDRTVSAVKALDGESRLQELAVMIGGPQYSPNALRAARELIEKAENWKIGLSPSDNATIA
jgi:DNA repair protein RecN (Recombination protein N)